MKDYKCPECKLSSSLFDDEPKVCPKCGTLLECGTAEAVTGSVNIPAGGGAANSELPYDEAMRNAEILANHGVNARVDSQAIRKEMGYPVRDTYPPPTWPTPEEQAKLAAHMAKGIKISATAKGIQIHPLATADTPAPPERKSMAEEHHDRMTKFAKLLRRDVCMASFYQAYMHGGFVSMESVLVTIILSQHEELQKFREAELHRVCHEQSPNMGK